jgi:hypothetical protein
MRDDVAAQHADFGFRVEEGDVDRDLRPRERGLVLGVEITRVAQRDDRGLAVTLEIGSFEAKLAALLVFLQLVPGIRAGQQHRMTQVRAGDRVAEDFGEETALLALEALLLLERQPSFGAKLLARGQRALVRGACAELVHAQVARTRGGELIVEAKRLHSGCGPAQRQAAP